MTVHLVIADSWDSEASDHCCPELEEVSQVLRLNRSARGGFMPIFVSLDLDWCWFSLQYY